ncbi:MAG TPA: hypothetical protein VIG25_09295 [Pyrinomonadaceae bacterium]|jgi:uncharacterized MAPEG superfamily protein
MANRTPTRHDNFFMRHAPILLIVSLVWFALTLQHRPISFLYIIAWVVIGLLYSLVMILGVGNRRSAFWDIVSFVILVVGGYFVDALLLNRVESDWLGFSQGMSIVFVCLFALNWALRRKLLVA